MSLYTPSRIFFRKITGSRKFSFGMIYGPLIIGMPNWRRILGRLPVRLFRHVQKRASKRSESTWGPFTPYTASVRTKTWDDSGAFGGSFHHWKWWVLKLLQRVDESTHFFDMYSKKSEATFFGSTLVLFWIACVPMDRFPRTRAEVRRHLFAAFPVAYRTSFARWLRVVEVRMRTRKTQHKSLLVDRLRAGWFRRTGRHLNENVAWYLTQIAFHSLRAWADLRRRWSVEERGRDVESTLTRLRTRPNDPAFFLVHVANERAKASEFDPRATCIVLNSSHGHVPRMDRTVRIPHGLRAFVVTGIPSCELVRHIPERLAHEEPNRSRSTDPRHNYETSMFGYKQYTGVGPEFVRFIPVREGTDFPYLSGFDPRFLRTIDRIVDRGWVDRSFVYEKTRFQTFRERDSVPNVSFHARDPTQGIRIYAFDRACPSFTACELTGTWSGTDVLWAGRSYTLTELLLVARFMQRAYGDRVYVISSSCLHVPSRRTSTRTVHR